jgi:hypothetical protein
MKKQQAPKKGNKDALPLPVTQRTMQEEASLLAHEFRTYVQGRTMKRHMAVQVVKAR